MAANTAEEIPDLPPWPLESYMTKWMTRPVRLRGRLPKG